MKASYRWLCELVPQLDASPTDLAEKLTRAGLEVEGATEFGAASNHVVLARVEKIEPHPSRSKLKLVTVDAGSGSQRVVCGAPNVPEPGAFVVLARLGTHLPAKGLTLEPRDIGGVTSEGMLCSEDELGLRSAGGDAGIIVFDADSMKVDPRFTPGATLASAVPESADTIFEIGLTPNRPDGLGHVGLAREAAALYGLPFALAVKQPSRVDTSLRVEDRVAVTIDDAERCPRYGSALVTSLKWSASPLGVSCRLEALGVRSISNLVDVTNLVMLKFGHPIHGFDLRKIRGGKIVVRRASSGEELVTLDGAKRKLDGDDLVIADGEGPAALAGVMGGAGSELADDTTEVFVECAYFTPRGIRRAARRHGMHTESSHRFERGVDWNDVDAVLRETCALFEELGGGRSGATFPVAGPSLPEGAPVRLTRAKMDALLGLEIPWAEARQILVRLGCREVSASETEASFVLPSHRPDLSMEEDLIEEVVRVYGIDRIPSTLPAIRPQPPRAGSLIGEVRRAAIEVGLSEALTFAFVSREELAALGAPEPALALSNPLTEDRSVMRTSLLPGLLEATRRARRHGVGDVRLFTTGPRFLPGRPEDGPLPHETPSFAAVIAGARSHGLHKPEAVDVFDAKGIACEIVERVAKRPSSVSAQTGATRWAHLHPRGAADLLVGGQVVGAFGPLHPEVERRLELGGPCFVVEIDIESLARVGVATPKHVPIPALPAATRDVAFVVHDDVWAETVASAIREAAGDLGESVELFDLFRGGSVPPDHRSLAFHVVYRDPKAATDPARARTLTDAEVDARHAGVVKAVGEKFGATLRGRD